MKDKIVSPAPPTKAPQKSHTPPTKGAKTPHTSPAEDVTSPTKAPQKPHTPPNKGTKKSQSTQSNKTSPEAIIHGLLCDVFMDKAYSGIALDEVLESYEPQARAYITRVFYGVIERSITFDYIIGILCPKKPKNSIIILLKMGLYLLRYSQTPDYAATDKIVSLAKSLGKAAMSGFINATLRKSTQIDLKTQKFDTDAQRFSVIYSYPLWLVKLLIREMGMDQAEAFLAAPRREGTHIRPNLTKTTQADFARRLETLAKQTGGSVEPSGLGYYVSHEIMRALPDTAFTAQSYASIAAAKAYLTDEEAKTTKTVLDLCGAPGGKSVFLAENHPHLDITCCDVHMHKIKLIESYARRMGVKITARQNDATVACSDFTDKFDLVICDVPCSGLGLTSHKPDIILNRKESDIAELSSLQQKILNTAASYVKKGGILCYSTCTITKAENQIPVENFLSQNKNFTQIPIKDFLTKNKNPEASLLLLPQTHNCDGFFIAKLKKQ